MNELGPGSNIDRYRLDTRVGEGGMASVFLATHTELGTRHALKVLYLNSPAIASRMLQEGRIQASLRHPNIVAVTDVVRSGGTPALVMEYVEGPALDGLLRAYQPSLAQADELARGIMAGVAAAHAKGLIHRDLKPGNILLAVEGNRIVPKVADFGLAKMLDVEPVAGGPRTRSGVAMGTPTFMAPEQVKDAKNVDHRADVFSLGAILYELVSGVPAFIADDLIEVYQATSTERYRSLRSLVPAIPKRMERAIEGALRADPDERIGSCDELLDIWSRGTNDEMTDPGVAWEPEHLELVKSLAPRGTLDGGPNSNATMDGGHAMGGTAVPVDGPGQTAVPVPTSPSSGTAPVVHNPTVTSMGPTPQTGMLVGILGLTGGVLVAVTVIALVAVYLATRPPEVAPEPEPVAEIGDDEPNDSDATASTPDEAPYDDVRVESRPGDSPERATTPTRAPDARSGTGDASESTDRETTEPPSPATESADATAGGEATEGSDAADSGDAAASGDTPGETDPPQDAPTEPQTGFSLSGVGRGYLIDGSGQRYPPGPVPPGNYTLSVFFDEAKAMPALEVTLREGESRTFECVAMMKVCK